MEFSDFVHCKTTKKGQGCPETKLHQRRKSSGFISTHLMEHKQEPMETAFIKDSRRHVDQR